MHVVHNCDEQYRQNTLALALERNAGNVFVMDRRGLNAKGEDVLYDHLPPAPYWNAEVREVDSYYDFGLDPRRAILAAYRYGVGQGKLYAWPNFEAAWYGTGHVRGTFLLNSPAPGTSNPWAVLRDVAFTDLPATYVPHPGDPPQTPSSFDIPRLWQAVHLYAQAQAGGLFETGIPTFELVQTASGPGVRVLLFASGMSWLHHTTVPVNATYQTPTFAEPGAVVRNVNRVATTNGALASFPTFVPDTVDATGRANNYDCYVIDAGAPVTWSDVPTSTYIQQL